MNERFRSRFIGTSICLTHSFSDQPTICTLSFWWLLKLRVLVNRTQYRHSVYNANSKIQNQRGYGQNNLHVHANEIKILLYKCISFSKPKFLVSSVTK